MKNQKVILVLSLLLLVLIIAGTFVFRRASPLLINNNLPSPTKSEDKITPPIQTNNSCKDVDLDPQASFGAAAGNVYGTFTIKNTSSSTCHLIGENFIQLSYDPKITNLKINPNTTTTNKDFVLAPGQILYSTIHFPNGPQCSTKTTQINVSYFYISGQQKIVFKDTAGKDAFLINGCILPNDITQIDLSELSYQRPSYLQ